MHVLGLWVLHRGGEARVVFFRLFVEQFLLVRLDFEAVVGRRDQVLRQFVVRVVLRCLLNVTLLYLLPVLVRYE